MIKLQITLGNSFFEHYYMPYDVELGTVLPKVSQHKFMLSKRLIEYYEECAKRKGLLDPYRTYLQNLIAHQSKCEFVKDFGNDSIEQELFDISSSRPMKILLAENTEISKAPSRINLLTSKEIKDNSACILNIYSIPVQNRYVKYNEHAEKYSQWLKNWLMGEKKISIRDKYLLSPHGIASLKKYYLPMFEKGAIISIYTDEEVGTEFIDEFDKPEYQEYVINIYKCRKMHERVIVLDDFQIVLGKGLDFLRADFDTTAECFISITEVTIDVNHDVEKQLR